MSWFTLTLKKLKLLSYRMNKYITPAGERCYAAAAERFPGVRDARWRNLDAVKKAKDIVALINPAIPKKADRIRIHGSGDFFKQSYFDA